jgi:two-component system sensor histidine kinase YesM
MSKIKEFFSSLKLSHKLTVLIIGTIGIPMLILSALYFNSLREAKIKEKIKSIEVSFAQNYGEIQTKVEVCTMSTQVINNYASFWKQIEKFHLQEQSDTAELLQFYKSDIAGLEKLINTNPYLKYIRVYVDSDRIPEMMPILYSYERMKRLSWSKNPLDGSGTWQFDFTDFIFPTSKKPEPHLVSYVTKKTGLPSGLDATIEVAISMELLFPDLYTSTEKDWTCFVSSTGYFYYNSDYHSRWLKSVSTIYHEIPRDLEESFTQRTTIDGIPVIVCYKPIRELGGHLIKIISLEDEFATVNKLQNVFWLGFFVVVLLLMLIIEITVKIILKQFYVTIKTVREVQKGDLEVRVPSCGNDEIGELGRQINEMLSRISRLLDDNIKREVLVKDSEIRALQNQINAHFIYNVLESVKMMAEVEEKYDISDAVTALGKLLRYSMKWVSKNVTVREEIDYIKNYLALINLRFDYEIYLSLNMPDIIFDQEIPKMSLQPIIENAIYHGIEGIAEDTSIYMKGMLYDGYCVIEITDSGKGMTDAEVAQLQKKINGEIETTGSSGNGIGLKNVQDRIKISFGEEYGIGLSSRLNCYTKVIIKIPLVGA